VKFEGHTQGEVASMQRLSQPTVSRIIDRYERWQAHADPREGGRLDPAERLRAQRWLTYERNELILGSALRIAKAVEGKTDLWKTVRIEPGDPYRTDKASVRDETTMIDRTGVAARFLRLAFKVNMEQLVLVEKNPPPLPEPLNEEEIAEEERQDASVAEEFRRQEAESKPGAAQEPPVAATGSVGKAESDTAREPVTTDKVLSTEYSVLGTREVHVHAVGIEGERGATIVAEDEPPELNLHNLHNARAAETAATAKPACTCAADADPEKNVDDACIGQPGNSSTRSDQAAIASTIRSFPAPASVATLPPGSPSLRGEPCATRRSP
jgi:hypothetical protein